MFPVSLILPAAIKLGDYQLTSMTSLGDVAWFLSGLLLLGGLTFVILLWHRNARPDPFL